MGQDERKFGVESLDNGAQGGSTEDVFSSSFAGQDTARPESEPASEMIEQPESANNEQKEEPKKYFDDSKVFEWGSDEFEFREKGKGWVRSFWGVIIVLLLIFGLLQQWTSMLLVVVGGLVVYQYAFKKPRRLHYVLTRDGLLVGEKTYDFDKFKSFWVSSDGLLYLVMKSVWPPRLTIILESVDVEELSAFLENYVKKEARKENDMTDDVSKWLKW